MGAVARFADSTGHRTFTARRWGGAFDALLAWHRTGDRPAPGEQKYRIDENIRRIVGVLRGTVPAYGASTSAARRVRVVRCGLDGAARARVLGFQAEMR